MLTIIVTFKPGNTFAMLNLCTERTVLCELRDRVKDLRLWDK
jgi:hypothetical protein